MIDKKADKKHPKEFFLKRITGFWEQYIERRDRKAIIIDGKETKSKEAVKGVGAKKIDTEEKKIVKIKKREIKIIDKFASTLVSMEEGVFKNVKKYPDEYWEYWLYENYLSLINPELQFKHIHSSIGEMAKIVARMMRQEYSMAECGKIIRSKIHSFQAFNPSVVECSDEKLIVDVEFLLSDSNDRVNWIGIWASEDQPTSSMYGYLSGFGHIYYSGSFRPDFFHPWAGSKYYLRNCKTIYGYKPNPNGVDINSGVGVTITIKIDWDNIWAVVAAVLLGMFSGDVIDLTPDVYRYISYSLRELSF